MCYLHHCLLAKSFIAKQNISHRANVICDGSPSRMRSVRRISFGITTRPSSSILLTMPVAFKSQASLKFRLFHGRLRFYSAAFFYTAAALPEAFPKFVFHVLIHEFNKMHGGFVPVFPIDPVCVSVQIELIHPKNRGKTFGHP